MQEHELQKLRQVDSATVCNVIELFEIRPRNRGFMTREIKAVFPELPPMVGFACTATVRTYAQPPERAVPTAPDFVSRFAETPGPPVAVLQNLDSGGSAALFGDVMCNSFKAFGAVGLVTDGPGRDYAGIAPLDFPVFCDGCVSSHGYNHMLDLQTPVQIGGISVSPGDLLHGDANGVTTIPLAIASDVADACHEFAAAEQVIIDVSQSGSASLTDLREAYAEKARRVAALGEKLRARRLH